MRAYVRARARACLCVRGACVRECVRACVCVCVSCVRACACMRACVCVLVIVFECLVWGCGFLSSGLSCKFIYTVPPPPNPNYTPPPPPAPKFHSGLLDSQSMFSASEVNKAQMTHVMSSADKRAYRFKVRSKYEQTSPDIRCLKKEEKKERTEEEKEKKKERKKLKGTKVR